MLGQQQHIRFVEKTHQYFDPQNKEYRSVSKLIQTIKPKFDREEISLRMAQKKAREEGIPVEQAQGIILAEWDRKRDSSSDWGNFIHNGIEDYLNTGTTHKDLLPIGKQIASFIAPFYKYYPEAILYDSEFGIAGQTDLTVVRQRTKNSVVDFYDYKTNEQKGIYYDSILRHQDGKIKKHINKFLLEPLSHLEDCNYNHYALQLSIYAYMAERTFGIKVGRLAIIFINKQLKANLLPIPYLRYEVDALMKHHRDYHTAEWSE